MKYLCGQCVLSFFNALANDIYAIENSSRIDILVATFPVDSFNTRMMHMLKPFFVSLSAVLIVIPKELFSFVVVFLFS